MTLGLDVPECKPSFVQRLDPRWKLASVLTTALALAFLQTWGPAAAALLATLLLLALARLPWAWYGRRLGTALVMYLLFMSWLPFVIDNPDGTRELGFSLPGLLRWFVLSAKLVGMISLMLVMLATTPLHDTFKAARSLWLPRLLVFLMLLTYRYVFLLIEEFARLRTALRVRGFRNSANLHSYRTIGQVAGTLLVRSHERSERVSQAMRCRGFDGEYRSLVEFRTTGRDVLAFTLIVGFAVGLLTWDWIAQGRDRLTAIDVNGLDFSYPDGKRALHGIRFQVSGGETVGLVGPNGAGKTTLFLCLAGVLNGHTGSLLVSGLDPGKSDDRKKLPAHVGIIFQNSDDQLFSTTVGDDVAFGPLNLGLAADEVRRRVGAALARVGLAGFEERVPFHLSGGEKRRVALAGVLAMQPEILLLDEPSMFLDPRGRRELIGLLNELAITKVIASHDLEMILDTCQRVAVLDQGRLVTEGPTRAVLSDAALMEAHGLEVPYRLR